MGSLYRRKGSRFWWMAYFDANGERVYRSSELEDRDEAAQTMAALEQEAAAQKAAGISGPLTLRRYGDDWLQKRREAGQVASIRDDESRWNTWVRGAPLSRLLLSEVKPHHLKEFIRELEGKTSARGRPLAPRSVRRVYELLRVMFADAVAAELVSATPCVLAERRRELPRNRDADPLWRNQAVYERSEVERLLSAEEVPQDRRVLYAGLFLTGARVSEWADRKWLEYDPSAKPLGRLTISSSFSLRTKESKETKTGTVRHVPVHPTLAAVLAEWRLSGWAAMLGRLPAPTDYIIPSRHGAPRRATHVLRRLHEDCERLGMRARRTHDTRRAHISLALADGADRELLRWWTHGPRGDVLSQYTTPPWDALCREMTKLNLTLLGGSVTPLRQTGTGKTKGPEALSFPGPSMARSTGLEPATGGVGGASREEFARENGGVGEDGRTGARGDASGCHNVAHVAGEGNGAEGEGGQGGES